MTDSPIITDMLLRLRSGTFGLVVLGVLVLKHRHVLQIVFMGDTSLEALEPSTRPPFRFLLPAQDLVEKPNVVLIVPTY